MDRKQKIDAFRRFANSSENMDVKDICNIAVQVFDSFEQEIKELISNAQIVAKRYDESLRERIRLESALREKEEEIRKSILVRENGNEQN